MKKRTILAAVSSFSLLGLSIPVFLQGCGGGGPGTSTDAMPVSTTAPASDSSQLILRTKMAISDADVAKLPGDFIAKVAQVGWLRVTGGFEKAGPGPNIKLTDGKTVVTTDSQGRFATSSLSSQLKIMVDDAGKILIPLVASPSASSTSRSAATDKATPSATPGATSGQWILDVPTDVGASCCEGKDKDGALCEMPTKETSATGGRSAQAEPMDGRCLDYNGWWSDGGNYGKTDWRAYRNFVRSDCERGFFNGCWRDHFSGGCWAVHGSGGCSRVIGHSSDYHKHNYPN